MGTVSERCNIIGQKVVYEHIWREDGNLFKTTIVRDSANWSGGKVFCFNGWFKWCLLLSREKQELPGLEEINRYSKPEPKAPDFTDAANVLEAAARDIMEEF